MCTYFSFGLRDITNSIRPQTPSSCYQPRSDCLFSLVPAIAGCHPPPPLLPPPFFSLSRTCVSDKCALQQLALNVHVKHSDLTWLLFVTDYISLNIFWLTVVLVSDDSLRKRRLRFFHGDCFKYRASHGCLVAQHIGTEACALDITCTGKPCPGEAVTTSTRVRASRVDAHGVAVTVVSHGSTFIDVYKITSI